MCTRYIPGPGARDSILGSQGGHLHGRERDMDRGKFGGGVAPQINKAFQGQKGALGLQEPPPPLDHPCSRTSKQCTHFGCFCAK